MYYYYKVELLLDADNRSVFYLSGEEYYQVRKSLNKLGIERESSFLYRLRNREKYFQALEALGNAVNGVHR